MKPRDLIRKKWSRWKKHLAWKEKMRKAAKKRARRNTKSWKAQARSSVHRPRQVTSSALTADLRTVVVDAVAGLPDGACADVPSAINHHRRCRPSAIC